LNVAVEKSENKGVEEEYKEHVENRFEGVRECE
jgi:hypothetical protein